jgi:hypothetical protein
MGAWGTRPYDNDTAADWFAGATAGMVSEITNLLQKPISDQYYDEYRAAAWILTKIGRNYVYDSLLLDNHLAGIHERLKTMRRDTGWIATWRNPTEIQADLDDLIQQVERVCKWNNVAVSF